MSDDAPVRLKHTQATSPELAHALRALGRSSDGERLQRVAQQLEIALAGGAPQPTAAGGVAAVALKWLITGVLAAGSFWAWHAERPQRALAVSATRASMAPHTVTADASAIALAADGGNDIRPAPMPNPADTRASAARAEPRPSARREQHAKTPNTATSPLRVTSDANPAAPTSSAPSDANIANPPANTSSAPTEPAATPPAPSPGLHEQSHSQPPPAAASQAGGERSEAALLLAARKAQPSAALRLLAEHATRFPDGLLAPEREVLRIQALRKLGRAAEAEQLLRAFQARYPDSIHLRRLLATQRD